MLLKGGEKIMNQIEDKSTIVEKHFYMATARNDDSGQCDACGKPFSAHGADMQLVHSGPSHRPPIEWHAKYDKQT